MKNLQQIMPAHADHISGYDWTKRNGTNMIDEMFKTDKICAQVKYDGERIKMHFDEDGVVMDSRRQSKKLQGQYAQCQQNFPELQDMRLYDDVDDNMLIATTTKLDDKAKKLGYTVLDGELIARRNNKDSWSDIVGIIHSLPERAATLKANKDIEVKYMIFDCLFYDGEDIRGLPYWQRFEYAQKVAKALHMENKMFEVAETYFPESKEELYAIRDEYIFRGYEGCVMKALSKSYYDVGAYIKAKKFETIDAVVYDFQEGRGKYKGTIGALLIGYYDEETDSIKHLSKVNCGTDADREMWRSWFNDGCAFGVVIEVKCQEITNKSLRHPVYVRVREDKDYKMCTKDSIFKEEEI